MAITGKVLTFTFTHAAQSDLPTPTYASSAAFKAAIDTQATQLQTAINSVIDQLNSIVALSSGAENIGSAPITGVTGATVYAQIADIKSQLTGLVLGLIPDGTITAAKLALLAVGTAQLADGAVTYVKHDTLTQTDLNGGLVYAYKNIPGGL